MPNPTSPTPASEWRKPAEGFVLELPSGKSVKVRRTLDMFDLVASGEIPNILKGVIAEAIGGGDLKSVQEQALSSDGLTGMMDFVNQTVVKAVIEPKVLPTPTFEEAQDFENGPKDEEAYKVWAAAWFPDDEDCVPLRLIEMQDRMFIFQVAQGGTTDLVQFRQEQATALAPVPNGGKVQGASKRTSGSRKGK